MAANHATVYFRGTASADCSIFVMASWKLFDDKLANAVRSKPILYNKRLKDFRNNMTENTWVEVAAAVGGTGK